MVFIKKLQLILLFLFILVSCAKEEKEISVLKETNQDEEMITAYKEAMDAYKDGDLFFSSKKFLEAELLFPQSIWAPKSVVMASYMYYLNGFYAESISNLERYLKTYPKDKNHSYANYLIAMNYYQLIEDEKRDIGPLISSKEWFEKVLNEYPNSSFGIDAKFKLDLIANILAQKEMYIGRHYIKKKKWIAAINRFKNVIENYDDTVFIDEAIHRLVEIYFYLGLEEESKKYAILLGYNYKSSKWYEKSYKVFNQDYSLVNKEFQKEKDKDKRTIIDKFKSLFE